MLSFIWTFVGTIAWLGVCIHQDINDSTVLSDRGWKIFSIIAGPVIWLVVLAEMAIQFVFKWLKKL